MIDNPAVEGCRLCGIDEDGHGLQAVAERYGGLHTWKPPTEHQRTLRTLLLAEQVSNQTTRCPRGCPLGECYCPDGSEPFSCGHGPDYPGRPARCPECLGCYDCDACHCGED